MRVFDRPPKRQEETCRAGWASLWDNPRPPGSLVCTGVPDSSDRKGNRARSHNDLLKTVPTIDSNKSRVSCIPG